MSVAPKRHSVIRELISVLAVAEAMSLELVRLVPRELLAPVLLVEPLVAPIVLSVEVVELELGEVDAEVLLLGEVLEVLLGEVLLGEVLVLAEPDKLPEVANEPDVVVVSVVLGELVEEVELGEELVELGEEAVELEVELGEDVLEP
jgi:hypothetical protein